MSLMKCNLEFLSITLRNLGATKLVQSLEVIVKTSGQDHADWFTTSGRLSLLEVSDIREQYVQT